MKIEEIREDLQEINDQAADLIAKTQTLQIADLPSGLRDLLALALCPQQIGQRDRFVPLDLAQRALELRRTMTKSSRSAVQARLNSIHDSVVGSDIFKELGLAVAFIAPQSGLSVEQTQVAGFSLMFQLGMIAEQLLYAERNDMALGIPVDSANAESPDLQATAQRSANT